MKNNLSIKNYQSKSYQHFDFPITELELKKLCDDPTKQSNFINHHRYLPFIVYPISFKKYDPNREDGDKIVTKTRNISLASHHDALLYKYYSIQLADYYEAYVVEHNIENVATAYRTNLHISNITAAHEIIQEITRSSEAWIIKGDFKHFFDNLNHKLLFETVKTVLGQQTLPKNWKKLLNSLTKYRFIKQRQLKKQLEIADIHSSFVRGNTKAYLPNLYTLDHLIHSKKIRLTSPNQVGIPQGTAISAVLANVYMINFDERLAKKIVDLGGLYRRYSDDFIIVLPKNTISEIDVIELKKQICDLSKEFVRLTVQSDKTKLLSYDKDSTTIKRYNIKTHSFLPSSLDYLGFCFDGHSLSLRPKNIYKFHYRGRRAMNRLITAEHDINHLRRSSIDTLVANYKLSKYSWRTGNKEYRFANEHELKYYRKRLTHVDESTPQQYHQLHKQITKQYLSTEVREQRASMLGYAKRSQKVFNDSPHNYEIVIEKQVRHQIKKNQKHLGESRKRNPKPYTS